MTLKKVVINAHLTASEVLPKYTYPAKWDCPVCGGEFSSPINEMVDGTADCPYCNDRKPLPGYNTFMIKHPKLMDEWDWVNNYCIVDPDNILDNNTTPVWWNCTNNSNHRYPMSVKR